MRIDRKQNLSIDEFKFPCKARQETPANQKASAPDNSAQKGVSHVTFQPKFPPAPASDRLIDASLVPAITEKTTTMSTPLELHKDELVPAQLAPKPKPKPLLCRQCETLQFRCPIILIRPMPNPTPLHPTRESFLESLRLGCRLCTLISSFLNLDKPHQPSRPGCERDHNLTFISLSMSWTKSDNFSAFDSPTILPVFGPFDYRRSKVSSFGIVYAMSVSGLATARMPRSTRMEVHRRHASGSCFPEAHGGYPPD